MSEYSQSKEKSDEVEFLSRATFIVSNYSRADVLKKLAVLDEQKRKVVAATTLIRAANQLIIPMFGYSENLKDALSEYVKYEHELEILLIEIQTQIARKEHLATQGVSPAIPPA